MAITLGSIICRSENQVSTEMDGETVLLNLDKGTYYGMSEGLTLIWNWLEQPIKVSEICMKLAEMYEAPAQTCEQEVLKVLGDLLQAELISIHNGEASGA